MRSILEKAIVHLLNEEHEQAQALFHKFMVERARQIHESLRNGEDAVLTEGWDENITSESYYTEDDLNGLEDSPEGAAPAGDDFGSEAGPVGDDMGGDVPAAGGDMGGDVPAVGDDMGGDDLGGDDLGGDDLGGAEMHGGEGDIADDLAEIKDQLASLTAEFEKLMGGDGDDDMGGDDLGGDDLGGGGDDFGGDTTDSVDDDMTDDAGSETDMASDAEADTPEASDDEDHKSPFGESKDGDDEKALEEEDFDDITESIVAELEKVSVTMTDGKEIAAGKSFSQNNTSVGLQKKPNPTTDGKPVQIKASEHKGFERETAPPVKDMKKRKNTKTKAEDGRSTVSKEGDKSALINKDFGKGGEANTKSPLAKR
jgi:hypothetical protein